MIIDSTRSGGTAFNNIDSEVITWVLAAGDSGAPLVSPAYADRSVQFVGTFGGATVVLEGSNDADGTTNYNTLTDPQGIFISKSGTALVAITEAVRLTQPRVVGGDVTTQIRVLLYTKR